MIAQPVGMALQGGEDILFETMGVSMIERYFGMLAQHVEHVGHMAEVRSNGGKQECSAHAHEHNSSQFSEPVLHKGAWYSLRSRQLARSSQGGYLSFMTEPHRHATHGDIVKRLKRANGHLLSVVAMIEGGRSCTEIAQQLHAVEKAITQAKRTLIRDHIDHCLDHAGQPGDGNPEALSDFKAITKFL
jgi:uncharacterized protein